MSRDLFQEFVDHHGGATRVPDEKLYQLLCNDEFREQMVAAAAKDWRTLPNLNLGMEVRRRCREDLFWLARFFTWESQSEGAGKPLGENAILDQTHRKLCNFFIKKDREVGIIEQDIMYKSRVLLWPRGGLKSTIDVIDAVQWILCFPEIRILFLTGDDDLAVGFVDELKGHFVRRIDQPSLMNLFFPEFCADEKDLGRQFEFVCPEWARRQVKRREPTVLSSSVDSSNSGFHWDVIKVDDAVTDRNSNNEEQCKKIATRVTNICKTLRPFGYVDRIGTRYADEDMYGDVLDKNVGDLKTTSGPAGFPHNAWDIIENPSLGQKILIGRALVIKPEIADKLKREGRKVDYAEAGEEGCHLLLPHMRPYSWCMREWRENEKDFEGQQNQNPRPTSHVIFEKQLLLANTVGFQEMPVSGPISHTWDFAFSTKKGRDYSTGCSVMWNDKAQMFVHDLVRGRMKHSELAKAVVDFCRKWRPFVIGIEDAAGSRFLEPTIIAEAIKTRDAYVIQVCSHIDWYPPDTQKDAKRMRMASLQPRLSEGLLKFANYIPFRDVLYSEFERCLTSHHHDDIPDVIAQQLRYTPRMHQMIAKQEMTSFSRADAAWNLLYEEGCDPFGRIGYGGGPQPLITTIAPDVEVTAQAPPGLDPMLGAGILG